NATVQAYTIQDLMDGSSSIDLLKLDVEGAEREIFTPPHDWLASVKNIAIELHGTEAANRFRAAMEPYQCEMVSRGDVRVCRNLQPLASSR
ncbi:MAG TPA: FkbM family methyltransferase, partial [Bryobacteraceae bacterium]